MALTAGQKAAKTRKKREPARKALKTHKNSRTFTKHRLKGKGYRCVTFESKSGRESADGVVDLVAIKKDKNDKDKLRIIFFQLKGGQAKINASEIARLKKAVRKAKIEWSYAHKPKAKVIFKPETDL